VVVSFGHRLGGGRRRPPRTVFQAILEVVVITGFNTDIEHNGTVYHVQTEDKGLETPFILSLVYVGGAILASKRSPYNDLIGANFDAGVLNERLQRQHRLICAAVSAGRIEDLKRLGQRETGEAPARADAQEAAASKSQTEKKPVAREAAVAGKDNGKAAKEGQIGGKQAPPDAARAAAPPQGFGATASDEVIPAEIDDALHLNLLEEKDFRAGEIITLRVMVMRGAFDEREIVRDANVIVKVLGTEFRPLILTSKTDADGVAVVHVWLPRFTRGRAAILVRATADGCSAELRRVIHHS
jgi:hypothetical protein